MNPRDLLRSKRKSYQVTFESDDGKFVLKDLLRFCRVDESCFDDDPRKHAYLEGRREVGMRIMKILEMNFEDYYQELKEARNGR